MILVFQFRFVIWGLQAGLTFDDLMNLGRSIETAIPSAIGDIVLFWTPSTLLRPFGELAYRLIWEAFGANPLPFRVAAHVLILVNASVAYFAVRATAPIPVALTVALLLAHHPFLQATYYNTGFLFDLLCFLFYFSALGMYLKSRVRNEYLSLRRTWAFLAMLVLALNSKELAVTLASVLSVWELMRAGEWTWPRLRPLAAAHLVIAAFLFGRVMAPGGIVGVPGYQTHYTAGAFLTNGGDLLRQFFALQTVHGWVFVGVLLLMALCAIYLREAAPARLGLAIGIVGVLPVAFLSGRQLSAAYIPHAGMVLAVASTLYALALRLLRRPEAAGVAVFLAVGAWLWRESVRWQIPQDAAFAESARIGRVLDQMRGLDLRLKPGAPVLMLKDPFPEHRWMSQFAHEVLTGNASHRFHWPADAPQPLDPAHYGAVLTFEDGVLRRER